jgi:hypothetical protein
MVSAIDQSNIDRRARKRLRGGNPGKTTADDKDFGAIRFGRWFQRLASWLELKHSGLALSFAAQPRCGLARCRRDRGIANRAHDRATIPAVRHSSEEGFFA